MKNLTRRKFSAIALGAGLFLAACGNGIGSGGAEKIDACVDVTLDYLYRTIPETQDLASKASGILVMPLITEAGFGLGGSFGRGALQVQGATVDYYSAAQASIGLQIGAQQFAHVMFFMTDEALMDFRASQGWVAGAEVEYAYSERGENIAADTTTATSPVVAVVFG